MVIWRRKWQPTPVSLPGKCHGQRSQVGCSPWGCKELGTTEWLTLRMKVVETKDWILVDTYLHVISQNWVIASYSSGMEAEILNISNPHSTAKLVMRLKFWICISWAGIHHLILFSVNIIIFCVLVVSCSFSKLPQTECLKIYYLRVL